MESALLVGNGESVVADFRERAGECSGRQLGYSCAVVGDGEVFWSASGLRLWTRLWDACLFIMWFLRLVTIL